MISVVYEISTKNVSRKLIKIAHSQHNSIFDNMRSTIPLVNCFKITNNSLNLRNFSFYPACVTINFGTSQDCHRLDEFPTTAMNNSEFNMWEGGG